MASSQETLRRLAIAPVAGMGRWSRSLPDNWATSAPVKRSLIGYDNRTHQKSFV